MRIILVALRAIDYDDGREEAQRMPLGYDMISDIEIKIYKDMS